MRYLALLLSFISGLAYAAPKVAVSLSAIGALTTSLMAGLGNPTLLQPANADPHHYQLKPSEQMVLQNADLVIWIGPTMEHAFAKPISQLNPEKVLTLMSLPNLKRQMLENGTEMSEDALDTDRSAFDPHIWLDPDNAIVMSKAIAAKLMQVDPSHKAAYQSNLDHVLQKLQLAIPKLDKKMAPLKGKKFYTFHDSLKAFDHRFGLDLDSGITDNLESALSLYRVEIIKKDMEANKAKCIFKEPTVSNAQLAALTEGSTLKVIDIKTLPTTIDHGVQDYIDMLNDIAAAFVLCS